MKRITFLILFLGFFMGYAAGQAPNLPHVSFSTKKGTAKDARDGKTYAFKQYGEYDWFMQSLNWDGYDGKDESTRGTVGLWGSADPDGSKFGRFYLNKTAVCPEGWQTPKNEDWGDLIKAISEQYAAPDLLDPTGKRYTFKEVMKYMRGGDVKSNFADALWLDGTGTVDAEKANMIQFNILPMGEHNGTGYVSGNEVGKRIWFLGSNNDRYQNNPSATGSDGINALRHQGKAGSYGAIRCLRAAIPNVQIVTPYPNILEISQITSTEKEVARHFGKMKRFDHVPTGFYLGENQTVKIKLTTLVAATDGAIPQIVIGTRGQMPLIQTSNINDGQKITEVNLQEGINTITAPSDARYGGGGIIYFRYMTKGDAAPVGKISIEILEDGDQVRAPHYIHGVTTHDEFIKMIDEYSTPEVIFTSDEVVAVASRAAAIGQSLTTDKTLWIEHLHKLLDIEDEISGMDDNDPNPLHHRMKKGEIRHLLVQTRNPNPNASDWRVAYPGPSRYLTPFRTPTNGYSNGSWQVAHEIGHQHQQNAYLIPEAGESTVNIYSFKVAAYFDNGGKDIYVRTPDSKLEVFHRTYLQLPDEKRKYEMPLTELQEIIEGINRDELRMVPWELQFYIFGDEFFKRLHRVTREERVTNPSSLSESNDRRKAYLISRASLISGYDLRKFYKTWGIVVDNPDNQKKIDLMIEQANLQEPPRVDELPYVSGTKFVAGDYAGWLPLSMDKGIRTSVPENWNWEIDVDRLAAKNEHCDYSTKDSELTDSRDGKKYPIKTFGEKIWFMSNLDWDGYDGQDESTKGTVGLYPTVDPEGKVYGRYYPTNSGAAVANTWCPEGWKYASKSDYDQLIRFVQDSYNFTEVSEAVRCMKCGGDKDIQSNGLWVKGAGSIDIDKSIELGINILPAGVFNRNENNFTGTGDLEGVKGSFVSEGYFHNVFEASNDDRGWKNRYSYHSASVRCVKDKPEPVPADKVSIEINKSNWDKESSHKVACDYTASTILLSVDENMATIVLDGVEDSEHEIDITKTAVKDVSFTVKTSDDEKTYTLNIVKDLKFDEILATKWCNVYIINNNTRTNGGYKFTGYKWFANEKEVSSKQYYLVKDKTAEYKLELKTANGTINTCPTTLAPIEGVLKVYPTYVNVGSKITIDASGMPAEFVDANPNIQIYGLFGYHSKAVEMTENVTQIDAPKYRGIYVVKVTAQFYEKVFKVIVK